MHGSGPKTSATLWPNFWEQKDVPPLLGYIFLFPKVGPKCGLIFGPAFLVTHKLEEMTCSEAPEASRDRECRQVEKCKRENLFFIGGLFLEAANMTPHCGPPVYIARLHTQRVPDNLSQISEDGRSITEQ